jgi:hypothetical protein
VARFNFLCRHFRKPFYSFISRNPYDIPAWNRKVDEYIGGVFDFAQIFLASDGVVLLFHPDDFKILKEVKSYSESYGFHI